MKLAQALAELSANTDTSLNLHYNDPFIDNAGAADLAKALEANNTVPRLI